MRHLTLSIILFSLVFCLTNLKSQDVLVPLDIKWSERMALSVMERNPDPIYLDFRSEPKWEYTFGLILKAIDKVGDVSGDQQYYDYVEDYYNKMINEEGNISEYNVTNFNIDRVMPGRNLFALYNRTGNQKYKLATEKLRYHLKWQPRNTKGGYWHKLKYPWQMWLDGAYMGSPFYAEYAKTYNESDESFTDIAKQFIIMNSNMKDPTTGLLYHGWDESKTQAWADSQTGQSPHFWGRAIGWYMMALVDVLDYFPKEHEDYNKLVAILTDLSDALILYQDKETGTWYQIINLVNQEGNYKEASATSMIAYAMAKGANEGYLSEKYRQVAENAFEGIINEFIDVQENGLVNLNQVCAVAGLGGNPYRDGSFEYYINEQIQINDVKGTGSFIKLCIELDR